MTGKRKAAPMSESVMKTYLLVVRTGTPNKSSDRHEENGVSTVNIPYMMASDLETF